MDREMKIAILTGVCAIFGSIFGSSMPQLIQHYTTPDAIFWSNKGNAYCVVEMYEDALSCFNKSIELEPTYENAWYGKGFALFNLGNYKNALTAFGKVIILNPMNDKAWAYKGNIYLKLEKHDQALEAYNNSLDINPFNMDALYGKGVIFSYTPGKAHEALDILGNASKLKPNDKSILEAIGKVWQNQNLTLYNVTMKLYVHVGTSLGRSLSGVRVTGSDAIGKSFDLETNTDGCVNITGKAGPWLINLEHPEYEPISWRMNVIESHRVDAFFGRKLYNINLSITQSTP
jgi:tetratricopeptide (TPR) repeat protein